MVMIPGRPTPANSGKPTGNVLKVSHLQWGSVGFYAYLVPLSLSAGILPRISTSGEASREGRQGVINWVIDDLSSGFLRPGEAGSTIGNWGRDKTRVYRNEGIIVHIPGITCLSYVLTTQTNLVALSSAGWRAANRRVHARMFNRRFIACIGPQLVKDTSTTNPALVVPATNDNLADDVLSMWEGYFNNTRYLVVGTDGQTDDVRGTLDPTASDITWVELVTHSNAADAVWAGDYFPDLGGGINIMIGQINGSNGIWWVRRSATVPVTTPSAVVQSGTQATPNASAPEETLSGAVALAHIYNNDSPGDAEPWGGLVNATVANDARATNAFTSGLETDYVCVSMAAQNWTSAQLPDNAVITDVYLTMELSESNVDDDVIIYHAAIWTTPGSLTTAPTYKSLDGPTGKGGGATAAGVGEYGVTPGEISDIDTSYSPAMSPNVLSQVTPAIIRNGAIGYNFTDITGTTPQIQIDNIASVTVKFRRHGLPFTDTAGGGTNVAGAFNQGGFTCGKLVSNPTRLPYVEPEADDISAVTVRRRLRFLDLGYDSTYQTVIGTTSTPATGIGYVGLICEYQGGVAVAGGRTETIWSQVKIVDADNQTRDLGFPSIHGAKAQTITGMRAQGNALLVWVADTDGTDAQLWIYFDGKWNALGPLQSKSSAITVEPLLWAECTLGDYQGYAYNLIPFSTNLGGSRVFVPQDLFADPHLLNTAQVKHDGPLYVQLIELDVGGAVEAQKALMVVRSLSRRIDDDTAYGDIRMLVDTGGDVTIAAAEVDKTFDTAFEEHNIVTSQDPGVALKTAIVRLIHDHAAASAKSPQALPIEWDLVGGWEPQVMLRCYLVKEGQNILNLYTRIQEKQATKRAQRFNGAGFDEPAVISDFVIKYRPDAGKTPPTADDIESAYIDLLLTVGSTS